MTIEKKPKELINEVNYCPICRCVLDEWIEKDENILLYNCANCYYSKEEK